MSVPTTCVYSRVQLSPHPEATAANVWLTQGWEAVWMNMCSWTQRTNYPAQIIHCAVILCCYRGPKKLSVSKMGYLHFTCQSAVRWCSVLWGHPSSVQRRTTCISPLLHFYWGMLLGLWRKPCRILSPGLCCASPAFCHLGQVLLGVPERGVSGRHTLKYHFFPEEAGLIWGWSDEGHMWGVPWRHWGGPVV